jgi:hypothetical protein
MDMKPILLMSLMLVSLSLFAQAPAASDSAKYMFKCKLTERVPLPAGCGVIAWALVQKFEVLQTDCPGYSNKYVLIIQPCPEFLGKDFFKKNDVYKIIAATTSGAPLGYTIVNRYKKEQLPIFWSRKAEKKMKRFIQ